MARQGTARAAVQPDMAWHGAAWPAAKHGSACMHDIAKHGMAWYGMAGQGRAPAAAHMLVHYTVRRKAAASHPTQPSSATLAWASAMARQ